MFWKDIAPTFVIEVNGIEVNEGVGQLITSLEYDSLDGGADAIKIQAINPELILTDKKIFQLGNVIKIWGGFENDLHYIGGARVEVLRPTFPGEGTPTLEVIAYTADRMMMRNGPPSMKDGIPFTASKKKKKGPKIDGRAWSPGLPYSAAVTDKALGYGFIPDVDVATSKIIGLNGLIQKTDQTDFMFVSGLANELGWLFWVDANELDNNWTLHFKDPDLASTIQNFELEFVYNKGDQSTLLSWEGEQLLGNEPTQVQIQVLDPVSGKLETYDVQADALAPPQEYDGNPVASILLPTANTGPEVTIAFGDVAVKVIADRQFKTPAEAKQFLDAWFRQNTDRFYSGRATVRGPGIEKLTARQVHRVSGLPDPWSGSYYMTNVVHKWTASGGYWVEWNGQRVPGNVI